MSSPSQLGMPAGSPVSVPSGARTCVDGRKVRRTVATRPAPAQPRDEHATPQGARTPRTAPPPGVGACAEPGSSTGRGRDPAGLTSPAGIATIPAIGTDTIADRIAWAVDGLAVELPTWGFVNTGTRFRVFPQAGVPRTVQEKLDDAGTVARTTGSRDRSRSTSRGTVPTTGRRWRPIDPTSCSGSATRWSTPCATMTIRSPSERRATRSGCWTSATASSPSCRPSSARPWASCARPGGLPADPYRADLASGEEERRAADRVQWHPGQLVGLSESLGPGSPP